MPRTEERRRELLEIANSLPTTPGVYIMRNKDGRVIYVGKSRRLKNRVSQYFQKGEKAIKTARMVAGVESFDYYLCDTEIEALSLENTLIKQYTPKYNIRLKDAKSYPYIKLTAEEYPRLQFTRKRESDKAKYFGPYSGVSTAYSLMELVNRILRLPTCKCRFPADIGRRRPCIYYQMNRCVGVCTGTVSAEEYRELAACAADILSGKSGRVKADLEARMYAAAEAESFETAARLRDTIRSLDALRDKQKVVADASVEQDIFALYTSEQCSAVSAFYIRSGVLQDKGDYIFGSDSILEKEDMTTFLSEHYKNREYIPQTVLLAYDADEGDVALLSDYLSTLAGRRITVRTPEKGKLRTLCDMVERNAEEQARQYLLRTAREEGTLAHLASLLSLEVYPERIEAYDISNLGKEHLTAGMIVCTNGKFTPADYRTFRIRTVENSTDDYASMREALERRLAHRTDEEGSFARLPDLILLDGGRGHVSTVKGLLDELGLSIPVFGMVKDDYHKTRTLCTEDGEISIAAEQDVFSLIYRIQEEVHRYTIGRMSQAKRRTMKRSSLTEIPGIGDAKAKTLLAAFRTMKALKEATEEEISAVKGISKRDAAEIKAYFSKQEKGKNGG